MLDFCELPLDGRAFEQLVREMLLIYGVHPEWTGKGPDQGRDLIGTERLKGVIRPAVRRWLVQCKHTAHSKKSVGRKDVGSVLDDCRQVDAGGYLLVCSTQPSSSLVTKLREIEALPRNNLVTKVWDGVDIEKALMEPRFFSLAHLFFPKSMSFTPWRLFNRGAPNLWTAQYKSYFLHLSSRVAGTHLNLKDCETVIGKLETVPIDKRHECLRPRAIYLDDKNENFTVFADYLVPEGKKPTLRPIEFNNVLRDGYGLYDDGKASWYTTMWDIAVKTVNPDSDHFHLDHYSFYNPYDGSFRVGISRGPTIGELADFGNHW